MGGSALCTRGSGCALPCGAFPAGGWWERCSDFKILIKIFARLFPPESLSPVWKWGLTPSIPSWEGAVCRVTFYFEVAHPFPRRVSCRARVSAMPRKVCRCREREPCETPVIFCTASVFCRFGSGVLLWGCWSGPSIASPRVGGIGVRPCGDQKPFPWKRVVWEAWCSGLCREKADKGWLNSSLIEILEEDLRTRFFVYVCVVPS